MIDPDEAFEAFVRDRGSALFRFAVALTGDIGSGEDLLQSVLVKVYGRWASDRPPEHPEAYTRAALVNAARLIWRRRAAGHEMLMADPPDHPERNDGADVLLRGALLDALRALPVRQRRWSHCAISMATRKQTWPKSWAAAQVPSKPMPIGQCAGYVPTPCSPATSTQ